MANTITISTIVEAPMEKVWESWNNPEHITSWCHASDDWHAPRAENDLKEGGKFMTRMEAKDGSVGFDFGGTYTEVVEHEVIDYVMGEDGRKVHTEFATLPDGVKITTTFEMEEENPEDVQRSGWQAILDNFKTYTEALS